MIKSIITNEVRLDILALFIFSAVLAVGVPSIATALCEAESPNQCFYVAPDGEDSSDIDAGTIDKPFKTFEPALIQSTPGDIIYARGGTYDEDNSISRSDGTYIILVDRSTITTRDASEENYTFIKAYPDEHPVLDVRGFSGVAVKFSYVHHWTLEGFEVIGGEVYIWGGSETIGNSHDIIIQNNDIHDFVASGGNNPGLVKVDRADSGGAYNIFIRNNKLHDISDEDSPGEWEPGLAVDSQHFGAVTTLSVCNYSGYDAGCTGYIEISGNQIYRVPNAFFFKNDMWGPVDITNNFIYNAGGLTSRTQAANIHMLNNLVVNVSGGFGYVGDDSFLDVELEQMTGHDMIVRNNTFVGLKQLLHIESGTGHIIENNVFFGLPDRVAGANYDSHSYITKSALYPDPLDVSESLLQEITSDNNCFITPYEDFQFASRYLPEEVTGTEFIIEHYSYEEANATFGFDGNSEFIIEDDPYVIFTDPDNFDYTVKDSAVCSEMGYDKEWVDANLDDDADAEYGISASGGCGRTVYMDESHTGQIVPLLLLALALIGFIKPRTKKLNKDTHMSHKIIMFIFFALLVAAIPSMATALCEAESPNQCFYVAPDGEDSSDSDAGTIDKPFKTFEPALIQSEPGDIIYARGGTYGLENAMSTSPIRIILINRFTIIPRDTSEEQYTYIRAYPGEHPVLDVTGLSSVAVEFSYVHHWTLEGFEVIGGEVYIWGGSESLGNSHDIIIQDNDIHDFVANGGNNPGLIKVDRADSGGAYNIFIRNNKLHDISDEDSPGEWEPGLAVDDAHYGAITTLSVCGYIGYDAGCTGYIEVSGNQIYRVPNAFFFKNAMWGPVDITNNFIYNAGGLAGSTQAANIHMLNNLVVNVSRGFGYVGSEEFYITVDDVTYWDYELEDMNAHDMIVRNNTFIGLERLLSILSGTGHIIENNVFFGFPDRVAGANYNTRSYISKSQLYPDPLDVSESILQEITSDNNCFITPYEDFQSVSRYLPTDDGTVIEHYTHEQANTTFGFDGNSEFIIEDDPYVIFTDPDNYDYTMKDSNTCAEMGYDKEWIDANLDDDADENAAYGISASGGCGSIYNTQDKDGLGFSLVLIILAIAGLIKMKKNPE